METYLDVLPEELIDIIFVYLSTFSKSLSGLNERYKYLYENFVYRIKKGLYDPLMLFNVINETFNVDVFVEILYEITVRSCDHLTIFGEHCTRGSRNRLLKNFDDVVDNLQYLLLDYANDDTYFIIFKTKDEYVFINESYKEHHTNIEKSNNFIYFWNTILTNKAKEILLEQNGYT